MGLQGNRCGGMKPKLDNPCSTCNIGQACCTILLGLKLTESEYMQHFHRYGSELTVQQDDGVYIVSSIGGQKCPNWNEGQCSVYPDRPIECRLFPYTLRSVSRVHGRAFITFHSRTRCPLKMDLIAPLGEATKMVTSFGKTAFGKDTAIEVHLDIWSTRWKIKFKKLIRLLSAKLIT
jgi:Fe-S-cluster containining protein